MIRLLTAALLVASFGVVADTEVPHTFNDGTPAKASEVNANFDALENAVDALPTPPSTCETNQIIKWNGSAWACATDPLANLSCSAGDTLTYDGSAFTCGCASPGTAITNSNFNTAISDWIASGNSSQYGDITKWCTEAVTDMSGAFEDESSFNADISDWNTSNVTNMNNMFRNASVFDQNISRWDTSNVATMRYMFLEADTFNQPIGSWDTGNVENMYSMFMNADVFNQNLSTWDTSKVADMAYMFYGASSFNQNISGWDVGLVISCSSFDTYAGNLTRPVFTACTP